MALVSSQGATHLQKLKHTNIRNLFRGEASRIFYAIAKFNGKQKRRNPNTTNKEIARRQTEDFRRQVGRLHALDFTAPLDLTASPDAFRPSRPTALDAADQHLTCARPSEYKQVPASRSKEAITASMGGVRA